MILLLILCLAYKSSACQSCSKGPIDVDLCFNNMTIRSDSIIVGGGRSIYKYFDIPDSYMCSIDNDQVNSNASLNLFSYFVQKSYPNFKANQGYYIIYNAIGGNRCDSRNHYQITLLSNDRYCFLLAYFMSSVYNHNFTLDVAGLTMVTNHSFLLSNSNIGSKGKWLFLIHDKNSAINENKNIFLMLISIFIVKIY